VKGRGLTLLETLVSLALLALLAGSLLVIYTAVLAGTRKADVNQDAVGVLDTVRDAWEIRIRDDWPSSNPPDAPVSYSNLSFDSYVYHVDDFGRIRNPLDTTRYLEMKRVRLRLDFKDKTPQNEEITRRYETVFHVVR
jgi:prepilin-type N-terminal cleavage/methylation domain-containing protein